MRYIVIPEAVRIHDPITRGRPKGDDGQEVDRTIPFAEFVRSLLLDPHFMANYKAVTAAAKIDALLDARQPGEYMKIEDADWELLRTVTEAPKGGYRGFAIQMLPFMRAIIDATDKPPKLKAESKERRKALNGESEKDVDERLDAILDEKRAEEAAR